MDDILPLKCLTPPQQWAAEALDSPLSLLSDHAHLEKKAAANALALLGRWPDNKPPAIWTKELSQIAKEESQHLTMVIKILDNRGGELAKSHRNDYAYKLRGCIRNGTAEKELLDRLLVSALIEARSCERFWILAEYAVDKELQKLYRGLWSSEKGHFETFLQLAGEFLGDQEITERFEWFLEQEAEIIQSQPPGSRLHSWPTNK